MMRCPLLNLEFLDPYGLPLDASRVWFAYILLHIYESIWSLLKSLDTDYHFCFIFIDRVFMNRLAVTYIIAD